MAHFLATSFWLCSVSYRLVAFMYYYCIQARTFFRFSSHSRVHTIRIGTDIIPNPQRIFTSPPLPPISHAIYGFHLGRNPHPFSIGDSSFFCLLLFLLLCYIECPIWTNCLCEKGWPRHCYFRSSCEFHSCCEKRSEQQKQV